MLYKEVETVLTESNPQVPKDHYFQNYDTKKRWMSYWHQIKNVKELNPKSILEIGPGNKTVSTYLENRGFNVTTVDIDPGLKPDFICDMRELSTEFAEDSFDLVLCAEVLEHLPFEDLRKALDEINYVCEKYVVLSLPHAGLNLKFSTKILPYIEEKRLLVKLPVTRLMKHEFDGEHHWEIGKKKYSLARIKSKINNYFKIIKTYCPYPQPNHRFFVLKVK